MKKFEVIFEQVHYYSVEVWAENEEEAKEQALAEDPFSEEPFNIEDGDTTVSEL